MYVNRNVVYDEVELSSTDAIEFLNEMGADPDELCPVCKHPDWGVSMSPGEGYFAALPTITQASAVPSRYIIGVYTCECLRCGYIRVHSLARLSTWKREKQDAKDQADE